MGFLQGFFKVSFRASLGFLLGFFRVSVGFRVQGLGFLDDDADDVDDDDDDDDDEISGNEGVFFGHPSP